MRKTSGDIWSSMSWKQPWGHSQWGESLNKSPISVISIAGRLITDGDPVIKGMSDQGHEGGAVCPVPLLMGHLTLGTSRTGQVQTPGRVVTLSTIMSTKVPGVRTHICPVLYLLVLRPYASQPAMSLLCPQSACSFQEGHLWETIEIWCPSTSVSQGPTTSLMGIQPHYPEVLQSIMVNLHWEWQEQEQTLVASTPMFEKPPPPWNEHQGLVAEGFLCCRDQRKKQVC